MTALKEELIKLLPEEKHTDCWDEKDSLRNTGFNECLNEIQSITLDKILEMVRKTVKDELTEDPTKKEWIEGAKPWEIEPCYECGNGQKIRFSKLSRFFC